MTDIPNTLEYLYQRVKAEVLGEDEQSKEEPSKEEIQAFMDSLPNDIPQTDNGFQTPFGYDPFISPNPFGGAMSKTAPF